MKTECVRVLIAWWVLVVMGCGGALADEEVLSIRVRPVLGDMFEFGVVADVNVVVHNHSPNAVVVERITPSTAGNEAVWLSGAVYGEVTKDVDTDTYTYGSMSQQMTQLAFYAGLLLPGEELVAVARYRPVTNQDTFTIAYDIAPDPYDGTAQSLRPFNVYVPASPAPSFVTRYVPFTAERWKVLSGKNTPVRSLGPENSPRAILLPGFEGEPKAVALEAGFRYAGAPFVLDEARPLASRISGTRGDALDLAYCTALQGYVVFERSHSWILASRDQVEKGELLAVFPPVLLTEVDTTALVRVQVGEKQEGFGPTVRKSTRLHWDRFPVFYGDGMYTQGEFLHLDTHEVFDFLRMAQQKGVTLAAHEYYFRSRYFVLAAPAADGE